MKKLLISLTLALISTSTWADWTEFSGSSNQSGVKVYYNLATLRNQDSVLKVWQMQDYNSTQTAQHKTYLSVKSLLEVNCKTKMRRTMAASYYKLNMGSGEAILKNSTPAQWEHIAPDITGEAMRKFYCGRE
ncbi:surface-adhesin E family protein [Methylotenera sp.]|uniref:surface-adhesin E family protein n=1 Tax=Methylotenera sp. TaxID=2051956 RepID=UPI002EDB0277